MARGDHGAAEEYAHQALVFMEERGVRVWLADTFDLLGRTSISVEAWAAGTRMIAAGDTLRSANGQRRLPSAENEVNASLDQARAALADDFDDVWSEGCALSIDDAIAYARRARGERKRPSFGWESLTPTELEVARHVADGLANPAIGERMFIGSGTVKTHLRHIFTKLDISSRSALAAEASRRESPIR